MAEKTTNVEMADADDQQQGNVVSDSPVPGGEPQSDLPDPGITEGLCINQMTLLT
jgi:hypothetical protein